MKSWYKGGAGRTVLPHTSIFKPFFFIY